MPDVARRKKILEEKNRFLKRKCRILFAYVAPRAPMGSLKYVQQIPLFPNQNLVYNMLAEVIGVAHQKN